MCGYSFDNSCIYSDRAFIASQCLLLVITVETFEQPLVCNECHI